jgi:hypothetical protein
LSYDESAARRLAELVDDARLELGLTKLELARIARVGRSTVANLINNAVVPAKPVTLERIGTALGWAAGSCTAVLAGGSPTLRPDVAVAPRMSARVIAARLAQIAAEAQSAAAEAEGQARRLRALEEQARATAQLALRTPDG